MTEVSKNEWTGPKQGANTKQQERDDLTKTYQKKEEGQLLFK